MTVRPARLGLVLSAATAALFAHATWIAPVAGPLQVGKPASIQIGNGHAFPSSEAALSLENLQVFAVAPSGARSDLKPGKTGATLTASYPVREAGMHRFAFVQDRGIISRTPQGIKPGGRDRNPGATQAMKTYRSAVAYAGTPDAELAGSKPLGLAFEMIPSRSKDSILLTVLLNSRPCAGAKIRAVWPGGKEQQVGAAGSDGKFAYRIPAGRKGQFLLVTSHSEKAAAGEPYDTRDHSTALHLNW